MGSLLERLEERETAVRGRAEWLRAEIASLSAELAGAEETLSQLAITRETVLSLLAGDDDRGVGVASSVAVTAADDAVGVSAADRQVLDVFSAAGGPLRAGQVCRALQSGTEHRQVERMRHRLKRMVGQRVLAEPEPGMFVMADPAAAGPVVAGKEE